MSYKQTPSHEFLAYSVLCKLIVITQALLFVSGCAALQGHPERPTVPATDLKELRKHIAADQIAACLESPSVACRNKIIGARLYATDIQFSEFEENLFQQTRTAGFSATLASLGLTSAAAGAGGVAAQVLSGAAAFIIGGREAYQKEVLAERTLVAIHTAMRAGRARVGLRLREGLRQDIDQYPLEVGLADLNAYYDAGTVLGALVGITESAGAQVRQAEEELRELRVSVFGEDESGNLIRAFIRPPQGRDTDPVNERNRRAVENWIENSPIAGLPIANFLTNPDLRVLRERAIREIPVP